MSTGTTGGVHRRVAGLVLAAGQASRFGADKRLARLPHDPAGRTLLQAVLQTWSVACGPLFVVLRQGDDHLHETVQQSRAQLIVCPDAHRGMGRSLACGVAAVQRLPEVSALLIGLADMPWVQADTLQTLGEAVSAHGRPVMPVHRGQAGHPRAVPSAFFQDLVRLDGDQGARHMIDWSSQAHHVEVDDPGVLMDVDRPADLWA